MEVANNSFFLKNVCSVYNVGDGGHSSSSILSIKLSFWRVPVVGIHDFRFVLSSVKWYCKNVCGIKMNPTLGAFISSITTVLSGWYENIKTLLQSTYV